MSDKGYTVIPDWMLTLDLDIYEVIILAVIYGFSQDGESSFTGSQSYLAAKAKCARSKVAKALPKLVKMGLITKTDVVYRGLNLCEYRVSSVRIGCPPQGQGGVLQEDTIIYNKNIDKERDIKAQPRFQKPSVAEVSAYCRERGNNIDPEEFVAFYESKGWMVGKTPMKDWKAAVITWEKSARKQPARQQPKRRETVFEHNLRAIDQVMGTNMHGQFYGGMADEQ